MRIVIDLQACQTPATRNRGIGRYTLSHIQTFVKYAGNHEVFIVLSNNFSETIAPLKAMFSGLLPEDNIKVFCSLTQLVDIGSANSWRHLAMQEVYQDFIAMLKPDVFLHTSIFDALSEGVTGILNGNPGLNAITLYDLIPYRYASHYLADESMRNWYLKKLQLLKNADILLAISEASRLEAIELLNIAPERIVNISSAIGDHFEVHELSESRKAALREQYGLSERFVLYTGGIEFRKNNERLIEAYGQLPKSIRQTCQLVIVCNVDPAARERVLRIAKGAGLSSRELVLTGFVPEDDLVDLYNLATLFVFPAFHEGFGLPALEAMACGVPTLVSNRSSLPEVVGRADAQFDPFDPASIAQAIATTLENPERLAELRRHGLEQAKRFSWERTAKLTLEAFENAHRAHVQERTGRLNSVKALPEWPLPKLAFVSPLPPSESGIADYSAELLPELAKYYDIDVITPQESLSQHWLQANFPCHTPEWFAEHHQRYDRVLYQFGNSHFHSHMFGLLEKRPGTVVLHDFYLSGILNYLQQSGVAPGSFDEALYLAHGYPGISVVAREGYNEAHQRFPVNLAVIDHAQGLIVHSEHSRELATRFYGPGYGDDWASLPLLRAPKQLMDAQEARQQLGLPPDSQIVASFGFVAATKLNNELLDAWLATQENNPRAYLIFVGRNSLDASGQRLVQRIQGSNARQRIRITGFASVEDYNRWLAAADVTVQLRGGSRGETSAAVLDCLVAGKPLIYNAHGSAAELPEGVAYRLPDIFTVEQLGAAIEQLLGNPQELAALGAAAIAYRERHAPAEIARRYAERIEHYAREHGRANRRRLIQRLRALPGHAEQVPTALTELACVITQNTDRLHVPVCYLDISGLSAELSVAERQAIARLLLEKTSHWRIELIERDENGDYFLACVKACGILEIPARADLPLLTRAGDAWLHLEQAVAPARQYARLRRTGTLRRADLSLITPAALSEWLMGNTVAVVQEDSLELSA